MTRRVLSLTGLAAALAIGCGGGGKNPVDIPEEPEIPGCTDIAGINYSRSANSDDGSCDYDSERFYYLTEYELSVDPQAREVGLLLQVKDDGGRGVPGLGEADFVVAENGRKVGVESDLTVSTTAIPFTIPTVLLLDMSSSVRGQVPQIKEAVTFLVESISQNQEMAIYVFDSETRRIQDFTSDPAVLAGAVASIPEDDLIPSTNLYGAIMDVAGLWEDQVSLTEIVDGSLVVFTDGFHNADPSLRVEDAIDAMVGSGGELKKIYVAALNTEDLERGPLRRLTFRTMGFFEADILSELKQAFLEIQKEITDLSRSFYLLTYTSPITNPESSKEQLEVAILGNSNLEDEGRIRARYDSEGFGN